MNKAELIEAVAIECDITRPAAARAVDSVLANIERTLKKGAARKGRNLKTNETIDIPARKIPKFAAGKNLKDSVE